jgi:hypothetical protein
MKYYLIVILIYNCSVKHNEIVSKQVSKIHNLKIELVAEDEILFEKITVKSSKKIPIKSYEEKLVSGNPLPLLFMIEEQSDLDIYQPDSVDYFYNVSSNKVISLNKNIEENYLVIEYINDKFFHFDINLYETKNFKVFFGFSSDNKDNLNTKPFEIIENNDSCIVKFRDDISLKTGNYGFCPKLNLRDNVVTIKLIFSKKEQINLSTRLIKYFYPGIFFLGPFTKGGAYYKRNFIPNSV